MKLQSTTWTHHFAFRRRQISSLVLLVLRWAPPPLKEDLQVALAAVASNPAATKLLAVGVSFFFFPVKRHENRPWPCPKVCLWGVKLRPFKPSSSDSSGSFLHFHLLFFEELKKKRSLASDPIDSLVLQFPVVLRSDRKVLACGAAAKPWCSRVPAKEASAWPRQGQTVLPKKGIVIPEFTKSANISPKTKALQETWPCTLQRNDEIRWFW